MTTQPCERCGAPGAVWQHPSGAIRGIHLDHDFTVWLCLECHDAEHAIRSTLGLDRVDRPLHPLERLELSLRRVAVTCGNFADTGGLGPFVARLGEWLADCAGTLARVIDAMDAWRPAWRVELIVTG